MIDWFTYAETEYGIVLNQTARNRFELYYRELVEWNSRFNLTAIRDQREIELKHFLDSISIAHVVTHAPESLVDVGTGAGFPGMALKILWPGTRLTLVESVQKKANFCMHVTKVLELREVTVLAQRAEDVGQDPEHREKYQLVTGRAVAAMPVLLEYLLPLAKPGGMVVMQKGENGVIEAENSEPVMLRLGGDLKSITPIELPEVEGKRYLVAVAKNARTPKMFPRRTGVPSKTPLS